MFNCKLIILTTILDLNTLKINRNFYKLFATTLAKSVPAENILLHKTELETNSKNENNNKKATKLKRTKYE